jgi:hypothetical protein
LSEDEIQYLYNNPEFGDIVYVDDDYNSSTPGWQIDHFNRIQRNLNLENLKPEDKAKIWLDKLFLNEIDLKTFKTGIDVLLPDKRKGEDIGYS